MGGIRGRCGKKREADDTETHSSHACIDTTKRIIGRKERQSIIKTNRLDPRSEQKRQRARKSPSGRGLTIARERKVSAVADDRNPHLTHKAIHYVNRTERYWPSPKRMT